MIQGFERDRQIVKPELFVRGDQELVKRRLGQVLDELPVFSIGAADLQRH